MEIIFERFSETAKKTYQDRNGEYLPVCEWKRVTCDDDGNVTSLMKAYMLDRGVIVLSHIPPQVRTFVLPFMRSTETLETHILPKSLAVFDISHNQLEGPVDLQRLSENLNALNSNHNAFTGSVCMDNLPSMLQRISLSKNSFSGTLRFQNLPETITAIRLDSNSFTGSFRLINPTKSLQYLGVSENTMTGTAVVSGTNAEVYL